MSRLSISTPCPPPFVVSSLPIPAGGQRLSAISNEESQDDTANIEYTRAFDLENKNAKPRRRSKFQRKERKDAAITIFEDVLEDQELVVEPRRGLGGSTLLAKPAQKPLKRVMPTEPEGVHENPQVLQSIGQGRRRSSMLCPTPVYEEPLIAHPQHKAVGEGQDLAANNIDRGLKKEPRRRTIFVPSDDTTLLTIHPGAQTTDRLNDTFQLPNVHQRRESQQLFEKTSNHPATTQPSKRPRLSMADAPKRVPLKSVQADSVSNTTASDVAGNNGGKENVPPHEVALEVHAAEKLEERGLPQDKSALTRSSLFRPTAASKARQTMTAREAVPRPRNMHNVDRPGVGERRQSLRPDGKPQPGYFKPSRQSLLPSGPHRNSTSPKSDPEQVKQLKRDEQRKRANDRRLARLPQYPVLSEDLAQPELYEDSWLSHQEIALTEVMNQLFADADPNRIEWRSTTASVRERLIRTYHQPKVTALHRRLHASLLYGALSRPKDATKPPDPAVDIGLRKRFISLWLDSYDHAILCTASEVVFGHQLPKRTSQSRGMTYDTSMDPHKGRRDLIAFLETFLVDAEDVEEADIERGDHRHPRWRKVILRSLMLIWLLDQTSMSDITGGCLLQTKSARKSSAAILQSLASMLIPSIGDVNRVLRHLDYEIFYVQDPLDEVQYRIDNIAVDLRDGVLLTRLVELLIFPSRKALQNGASSDATLTIQMPDFTILESTLYDTHGSRCLRILSKHLKMPCLGRAQKVYNVELAISALREHGRLRDGAGEVYADDIVNGHREKTVSLLWSLVSSHGLGELVDFGGLTADIKRTSGDADVESLPNDCLNLSQSQHESLLKKWASAHCARQGIRIGNLTTAFADGKAYAAILNAFMPQTGPDMCTSVTFPASNVDLKEQLRCFGCSTAFIDQIVTTTGTIPSRKTTISNLAFLASRLLPLACRQNAALVIQRVFRRYRASKLVSRRITLLRLVHACATVVETSHKLNRTAVVLQRAWRRVLDYRIDRLNRNVGAFQYMAKGWLARRRVQKYDRLSRVMGGW